MGLPSAALRFLAREHRRDPFRGPVLILGRQYVFMRFADVCRMMKAEGLTPADLPSGIETRSNIPEWRGTPLEENISDVALFHLFGLPDLQALDCSTYEGAEIVADLNRPIPDEWRGRFGLVLDTGTLEHIFDVRQAIMNIASMVAPGGRVIHMSPANNYLNHGFYQLSPTQYLDYYRTNKFADLAVYVAEQEGRDPRSAPWDLFHVDARYQPACMRSRYPMLTLCSARRTVQSTVDRVPIQSHYERIYSPSVDGQSGDDESLMPVATNQGFTQRLKRLVPLPVRDFLRPYIIGHGERKPWGCVRVGRLR